MAQGTADMLSPHLECLLHTLPAPLLWPLPVRFSVWGSLSLLTDPPPPPPETGLDVLLCTTSLHCH